MDISETLPPELERFWSTNDGLTAVQRAEAYYIDVSLLDANLRLSPTERLDRYDSALELITSLQGPCVEGLKALLIRLVNGDVRCAIAGGYAVALRGSALITAKRAMGRLRDLHAVLELEAIRERLRSG